jgi:hypothetical protein
MRLHERDREQGIDPFKMTPIVEIPSPRQPGPGLVIPPADWPAIQREEAERERQQRIREAAELLESDTPPEQPTAPAATERRWLRSS